MKRSDALFYALLGATALTLSYLLYLVFLVTPLAQQAAGGIAQKIFYLHVPAAYAMYLGGALCFSGSVAYLLQATPNRDAWARAGAEIAVLFGALVLVSGPLWARKAWGVYWTWDPRLTTLLLSVLVYGAIVVLRSFTEDGEAERKFAAALGVLGTVNLPVIHYAVKKWGGNHPTVITGRGRGLGHSDMYLALGVGFVAITLLALLLFSLRVRLAQAAAQLRESEERASAAGVLEEG